MLEGPPEHEDLKGKRLELTPLIGQRVLLGRGSDCHFSFGDPTMARKHAIFEHIDDRWQITDTGSTNGTRVNGEKVNRARLKAGDRIVIGLREMVFLSGDVDELYADLIATFEVRDAMTKVYNRRYFVDRLDKLVQQVRAHQGPGSLALIDIGNVKRFNDMLSREVTDALINGLASVLTHELGAARLVGRVAGKRFGILFPGELVDGVVRVCAALVERIAGMPFLLYTLRSRDPDPLMNEGENSRLARECPPVVLRVGVIELREEDEAISPRHVVVRNRLTRVSVPTQIALDRVERALDEARTAGGNRVVRG